MGIRSFEGGSFFQVHNAIVDQYSQELTCHGIALYCALARRVNNETQKAMPSYCDLAELAGMGESSVKKYLKVLEENGLVRIVSRSTGKGRQTSNEYTLLMPKRPPHRGSACARRRSRQASTNNTKDEQNIDIYTDLGEEQSDQGVASFEEEQTPSSPGEQLEPQSPTPSMGQNPNPRKWQVPDNDEQRSFLAITRTTLFERGIKQRVAAIFAAIARGDTLGDGVYDACWKELERTYPKKLSIRSLPPIPRDYLAFREKQARKHRWTQSRFVGALLNREALTKHCDFHKNRLEQGTVTEDEDQGDLPF